MSTFDGVVKEIPFVRIDRFSENDKGRIFFISHCHSDHMEGLSGDFFDMLKSNGLYLYASPISVRILKNKYPNYNNQLKALCVGEVTSISIDFNGKTAYLNVLVIPAGHCPGSVMFLLETDNIRVLYTGDFRIDKKEQFFKKYFGTLGKIDNIYLDTTFCKKQYQHFPSRKETATSVCEIIANWLSINENNLIYIFVPANCGSEYIFREIFKETQEKLYVPISMFNLHKFMPEMDNIVKCSDPNETRIHVKLKAPKCSPNSSIFLGENICAITITAMIWEDYEIGDSIIKCESINSYRVCASYHPSYTETCEFIDYLKPIDIVPCVLPKNEAESQEMIQLLNCMKNQYKRKVEEAEIFAINPTTVVKQSVRRKQKHLENHILSSPPRKFSRKRCLDVDT